MTWSPDKFYEKENKNIPVPPEFNPKSRPATKHTVFYLIIIVILISGIFIIKGSINNRREGTSETPPSIPVYTQETPAYQQISGEIIRDIPYNERKSTKSKKKAINQNEVIQQTPENSEKEYLPHLQKALNETNQQNSASTYQESVPAASNTTDVRGNANTSVNSGSETEPRNEVVLSTPEPSASTPGSTDKGISKEAKGAIIGGVAGTVIGAAASQGKPKGALIGAVVGAGAGYLFGKKKKKKQSE